jgi:hypothetical protein
MLNVPVNWPKATNVTRKNVDSVLQIGKDVVGDITLHVGKTNYVHPALLLFWTLSIVEF